VASGAHFVRFADDDQIRAAAQQGIFGVFDAGDPPHRGHHLILLLPGIHSIVGAQDVAADDLEVLAELVLQLALPLEREVGRRDDEHPLDQAANL
jgi:hypothetical protein